MFKKSVLLIVVISMFITTTLTAQSSSVESDKLVECFSDRYHDLNDRPVDGLAILASFENQLITRGYLNDPSQNSYVALMTSVINGDVRIPSYEWNALNPDFDIISMPSNLATTMLCFLEVSSTVPSSPSSSVVAMASVLDFINDTQNIGSKFDNRRLINAAHYDDFAKIEYRATILTFIHSIANYKEEMQQYTSDF